MFQMPNPDLLEALRRIPAEGSREARDAAHRREWRKARQARRRAVPGGWLVACARYLRALAGTGIGRVATLVRGERNSARFGECAGAG